MDGLHIDGVWLPGEGAAFSTRDPATGDIAWRGASASPHQVDAAVRAARAAAAGWRSHPHAYRVAVVERFAAGLRAIQGELAAIITTETGKPLWESATEVAAMIAKVAISIEALAERAGTTVRDTGGIRSVTRHRPHGVLAVLGPYNFPGHLPNGHIVPALLAGNTVVFKPSEISPATGMAMVRQWEATGLPGGVLNLVQGGGDVGRHLAGHEGVDGVLFTGSARVGGELHRAAAGRPGRLLALEMGGNNPMIVRPGVDITDAVDVTVQSAYISAGQRCSCTRRLLVPDDLWGDRFVAALTVRVASLEPGDPRAEPPPFLGPVATAKAADGLLAAWQHLVDIGGVPLVTMLRGDPGTGFVSPGLIDVSAVDAPPDEEYFGPLLQVIRYRDLDQAIAIANRTRFGLAAGIIGEDVAEYERVLHEVRAGVINWNRPTTGAASIAPFGGLGESGNLRPSAYYAADYVAHPVASLESPRPEAPPLPGLG